MHELKEGDDHENKKRNSNVVTENLILCLNSFACVFVLHNDTHERNFRLKLCRRLDV